MSMERVWFRGKIVNTRTKAMLERAEARLGYELTIVQGSYNSGVSASAGTHDGGGAVDLTAYDYKRKVLVLRQVGFAAWYRPAISGLWGAHIHAIAIGDPELSSGARNQVTAYYNRRDGLAGYGPDNGPRLSPIPTWPVPLGKISLARIENQFKAKNPTENPAIKKLQRLLNWRMDADLLVDGVAGPVTRAAYAKWEKKIGAPEADGVPGVTAVSKLAAGFYQVTSPEITARRRARRRD